MIPLLLVRLLPILLLVLITSKSLLLLLVRFPISQEWFLRSHFINHPPWFGWGGWFTNQHPTLYNTILLYWIVFSYIFITHVSKSPFYSPQPRRSCAVRLWHLDLRCPCVSSLCSASGSGCWWRPAARYGGIGSATTCGCSSLRPLAELWLYSIICGNDGGLITIHLYVYYICFPYFIIFISIYVICTNIRIYLRIWYIMILYIYIDTYFFGWTLFCFSSCMDDMDYVQC